VRSRLRCLLLALLSPLGAIAQVQPGDPLPSVLAEAMANAGAPRATVWWCALGDKAPRALAEAPAGVALAARFGPRGVAFVAVVDGPEVSSPAGFDRVVAVAGTDPVGIGRDPQAFVVVSGRDGLVRFVGEPAAGLADALDAEFAGAVDLAAARAAHDCRRRLGRTLSDLRPSAVAPLHALLAHAPRDGVARGLLYLVAAVGCRDEALAQRVADAALASLAEEPRALAAFLDLAMRGEVRKETLAQRLLPAARRVAAAAPRDRFVQLAALRVLVHARDGRTVGRTAIHVRRLARDDAAACVELAGILAEGPDAPVHADLAAIALAEATSLGAEPRALAAARFAALSRGAADDAAAARTLDGYLAQRDPAVSCNNDCWRLLTDLRTMGRATALAAGLADRMAARDGGLDFFECDTAGLAMFFAGRAREAEAYAEAAVARAGAAGADYADRLRWYREHATTTR
jgi:hypothetical protein